MSSDFPDVFVEAAFNAGPHDIIDAPGYLLMDGSVGSGPSTPDSTSYNTNDLDLRIDVDVDLSRNQTLIGKWEGGGIGTDSDFNNRSFVFWVTGNRPTFSWSEDGTNLGALSASPFTDTTSGDPALLEEGRQTVRVSFDADNGDGGYTAVFYTGPTLDGPWTTIGVPYTMSDTGTASIFDSTTELRIGEILYPDSAFALSGKVYGAVIYSGTNGNTTLANPDFSIQPYGTLSFTDGIGKPWDLNDSEIRVFNWTDLSDDVIGAQWGYGREDELEHFPAGEATVVLLNDDRKYDPEYSAGDYYGTLLPRVPVRILSSSLGLSSAGFGTNAAGTPDHVSYSMSDIDVRVHASFDDYTPTLFGRFMVSQYATGNIGWAFALHTDGTPLFIYSTDGTATVTVTGSGTVGVTDLDPIWFRATFDAAAGTSNETAFYKSDDGLTWTQIGTTSTRAGNVSIFNSTAALSVGSIIGPAGYFYEMDLRSGIDSDTSVANPKFYAQAPGASTFADSELRVWTVSSSTALEFNDRWKLDQFYGFVENGWEQELYPPEGSNCTIRLVDKLGVIAGASIPDPFDYAILNNNPVGYWVLNGPNGTETVADGVTPAHDGAVEGSLIQFGENPVRIGHPNSARFSATTVTFTEVLGRVTCASNPINTYDPRFRSVVATFRAAQTSPLNYSTIFVENNGVTGTGAKQISLRIDDVSGCLDYLRVTDAGGSGRRTPSSVMDGNGHLAVATNGIIWLDGVYTNSSATMASIGGRGVGIGGLDDVFNVDHFNGWIGAAALFPYAMQSSTAQVIYDGYNKLEDYRSDQQIEWGLLRLGVDAEQMNLDEGYITMGVAQPGGRDALEWIREITATEGGAFYVDHRDGGKLRFTNRYHRYSSPTSTTAQIAFSDDPDRSFYDVTRVERDGLDVAPNGIDSITNQVLVSWQGGEVVVEDATSIKRYGQRARQLATQATIANIARNAGEWVIAKYVNPQMRINKLEIFPGAAKTAFKAALNLRIDDRVSYRSHPQMVGSAIETELWIDGITHTVERGVSWRTTYAFAQALAFVPWIWDVSAWDESTYWG